MSPKTAGATLSMFGMVTEDLSKTLAFYRKLGLDIPADADNAPHAEVTLPGGVRLAWDTVETIRSFAPNWKAPKGGDYRFAVAFEYDSSSEVDAAYKELVEAGAEPFKEPFDAVWGQRYAIVKDPDGNAVDLFSAL